MWKHPFVRHGKSLSFDEAMALFRDRTGRPGPSTWELGGFPEGHADYPVSGVSWYEAAAYAEFVGKSLPTLHHWYRAADLSRFSDILPYSNFGGEGPRPVGQQPSLTSYGNLDMAGNVREWAWNADGDRRYTLGGAWSDPTYLYTGPDALDPMDRSPILGLRCALYETPPPEAAFAEVQNVVRDLSKERPVDDGVFRIYRRLFDYDPTDLGSKVESVDDRSEHWREERVSFAAAYGGERIPARLFLPKNARPPFQTVIYFPPGERALPALDRPRGKPRLRLPGAERAGGAVSGVPADLRATPAGSRADPTTFARSSPSAPRTCAAPSTSWTADRTSTTGASPSTASAWGRTKERSWAPWSTGCAPSSWWRRASTSGMPPEVDGLNFAPRVRVPVLMVNGRYDFGAPFETNQLPLFRLLGSPAKDKKHVVFDSGHVPPWPDVVRETLDWLDRYLGPVTTGRPA